MFTGKPVLKGFYDWLGVTNQYVTKGKNSGLFKETEHWTPEEKAKMTETANHVYYDNFVPKVAKGRNKTNEEINSIGQGRVWTGTQAKSNGLIDEFGGLEKAIDIAKQLADLPADKDVRRVVFPEPRPFLEAYFGSDDDSTDLQAQKAQAVIAESLPREVREAFKYSFLFDRMGQGDAMLMMPFELKIK